MWFLAAALALHLTPVSPASPNLQPQLAVGPDTVALVFGSGESIWFAKSADHGKTFDRPAKVADLPKMSLRRHRGPRITFAGRTIVITAIASDLYAWRSVDGGRTWSKPAIVNDRENASREGLHAMSGDAEGNIALAWLDDRTVPGKRLYGAFSHDGGATWSKNALLYESPSGTICQCCAPSMASLGHGEFAVMWRNALDGSRDLYTLRVRDGKVVSPAAKLGTGTWKLDACPMDGGGIAVSNGSLISAWRRERDIYLAAPGAAETKLGPGQDVAIAANDRGAYAVWSTPQGIELHRPKSAAPERLSDSGGYPTIVALPDGSLLAAWEENNAIAMHRVER
jgi:hypothetical protein